MPLMPSEHAKIGSLKGAEGNVRHIAMEDAALACRCVGQSGALMWTSPVVAHVIPSIPALPNGMHGPAGPLQPSETLC